MTRYRFTLGAVSLAVALGAAPALAGQAGGRPSGGSPSVGTATPSGGGSATGTSSSSSSSSSSSATPSSSGTSSGSSSNYAPEPRSSYSRDSAMERAPQRPSSGDRPSGAQRGGERAVPRGTAGGEGGGRVASTPSGSSDNRTTAPERRAVPSYSRPRDGRTPLAQAGVRTTPIIDGGRYGYFYDPSYGGYYYDPYGYYGYSRYGYYGYRNSLWWPGYGMGLSYFYDPFYDPFWYGGAGYGGGYPGYYGSYSGYSRGAYHDVGALRLKVRPRDAQVLVDGYFVGTVDDFDGVFQKLNVDAGSHRIELRAPGFAPVQFDVMVTPGETITYKGDMRHIQ